MNAPPSAITALVQLHVPEAVLFLPPPFASEVAQKDLHSSAELSHDEIVSTTKAVFLYTEQVFCALLWVFFVTRYFFLACVLWLSGACRLSLRLFRVHMLNLRSRNPGYMSSSFLGSVSYYYFIGDIRLIAVLHLFEGRSLGVLQFILSLIGIYASWEDVTSRIPFITTYAIGCFIWAIIDGLYLLLLIAASSKALHKAAVGFVVSNTFPNLSEALDKFFESLAEDAHFFSIFSALVSVFFDSMAALWGFSLYTDAKEILATSDVRVPLLRPQPVPHRGGISGFGSLSRQGQSPQTTPRTLHPFAGRGHRLGFGDS